MPDKLCAEEEIRTPTPGYGRYHLKVVRLPISPPPHAMQNYINLVRLLLFFASLYHVKLQCNLPKMSTQL